MATLITDVIDVLLDPVTHDIVIENGDAVLASGLDAVSQQIKIALLMVKGEWFMDLEDGVPYFERAGIPASRALMGSRYNSNRAVAEFRKAILKVSDVVRITSLSATFAASTRTLSIRFTVRTSFGDTVADTLERTI